LILEGESFSLPFDVEADLGCVGIDDSSSGVHEWASQNDVDLLSPPVSTTTKSARTYELPTHT
jgi:hypothetical protein